MAGGLRSWARFVRHHFVATLLAGFTVLIPVVGAIVLFEVFQKTFGRFFAQMLPGVPTPWKEVLGVVLAIAFIVLVGILTTTLIGRRLLRILDRILQNVPLIGLVYSTIVETLGLYRKHKLLRKPVIVDVDAGIREIGFMTTEYHDFKADDEVVVFVPGVPIPASGRLLFVKREQVAMLPCDSGEVFRTLLTLGNDELLGEEAADVDDEDDDF